MIITIVVFLVVFSVVVLAHEMGHYYFAVRAGVKVEEFGFGLPPRIWGRQKGDTLYSINAIPFGGFVRLYGEDDSFGKDPKAFISKTPGQKFGIVVGGVLMNFILGLVVMMVGFWLGMPPMVTAADQYVSDTSRIESRVLVGATVQDSIAAKAGLMAGDYILASGQDTFSSPLEFKDFVQQHANKSIPLLISRGKEQLTVTVVPKKGTNGDFEIGVYLDQNVEKVHYIWWQVPWLALQETWRIILVVIVSIANLVYRIFTTASLPAELAGPVGIATITATVVKLGWLKVLQFVIFLSINLGVLNLVPFPGLDGGRLVFVLTEFVRRGKRVPAHIEGAINTIGFVLLMLLIAVVTYKDILKLI